MSESSHPTPEARVTPPPKGAVNFQVGQTPREYKISASEPFATLAISLDEMHTRLVEETRGHYLGPMPVEDFFEEFMPWNNDTTDLLKQKQPSRNRVKSLRSLQDEGEKPLYKKLIDALNGWAIPKSALEFVDSHSHRDKDCKSQGVDVTVYAPRNLLVPRENLPKMDFANAQSWIEIKPARGYDAFVDPPEPQGGEDRLDSNKEDEAKGDDRGEGDNGKEEDDEEDDEEGNEAQEEDVNEDLDVAKGSKDHSPKGSTTDSIVNPPALNSSVEYPFENNTVTGRKTRAQLASYAGATMATQFRSHLFTTLIIGDNARFIRWDRSGAIVTRAFNYTKNHKPMFEFFKRFSQLTLSQRGNNPAISPATAHQARLAREALKAFAPELWLGEATEHFKDVIDIETQPFLRLRFDDRDFILPSPHCSESGLSPFGRASRGRTVFDPNTGDVLYLKDAWRDTSRQSEVDIYTRLKEHNVSNVATLEHGGDIGQTTQAQLYVDRSWVYKNEGVSLRLRTLQGAVLVLDTIGIGLVTFRIAYQLVSCIADGMQAYEEAFAKANVMHRDVSVNNILMVKDLENPCGWKGILIDWDHSVIVGEIAESSILRTGTWNFMSIALRRNPDIYHTELDDRESALHVLTWVSLRHLQHALSATDLTFHLKLYDQMARREDFMPVGSPFELHRLRSGYVEFELKLQPISDLIEDLSETFASRYGRHSPKTIAILRDNEPSNPLLDPNWLVARFRQTLNDLPSNVHAPRREDMDWTDNVQKIQHQVLPADSASILNPRLYMRTVYWTAFIRASFDLYPGLTPTIANSHGSGQGESSVGNSGALEERSAKRRRMAQ